MFEALHLTEVTRACAALTRQAGTNASHPGVLRMLSRIALNIVFERWDRGNIGNTLWSN
jgi:hypothetical protein